MKTSRIKDTKLDEILLVDQSDGIVSEIVTPPIESIYRFVLNGIENKTNITVLSNQLSALNHQPIPENPLFTADQISSAIGLSSYALKDGGGKGEKGDPGKSAYQIAVDNGFKGSEEEWLESLKGTNGRFEDLTDDQKAELKGDPGEIGPRGDPGPQGPQGEKGDPGEIQDISAILNIVYPVGSIFMTTIEGEPFKEYDMLWQFVDNVQYSDTNSYVWKRIPSAPDPNICTVTYHSNTSIEQLKKFTVLKNNIHTIQSYDIFKRQGYEIIGWTFGSQTYEPYDTIIVTSNIDFYAKWKEIETKIDINDVDVELGNDSSKVDINDTDVELGDDSSKIDINDVDANLLK